MLNRGILLAGMGVLALSVTTACAQNHGDVSRAFDGEKSQVEDRPFEIKEDTLICWRIVIDKDLYFHFDEAGNKIDANYGLAADRRLIAQHEKLFGHSSDVQRRVLPYWPTVKYPMCEDKNQNIIFDGYYELRSNGAPFQATYKIKQGSKVIKISYEFDLKQQYIDKGLLYNLESYHIAAAIVEDINKQVDEFVTKVK